MDINIKICTACHEGLSLSCFDFTGNGKPRSQCKGCRALASKIRRQNRKLRSAEEIKGNEPVSKRCSTCRVLLPIDFFYFDCASLDGRELRCKTCCSERGRDYYENNRDKAANKWKAYYDENKAVLSQKVKLRNRTPAARAKRNAKLKLWRKDPRNRMMHNARNRISGIMKGKKPFRFSKELGCAKDFFFDYIEKLWLPGMSWENYGFFGWHLDHIIPLASVVNPLSNVEEFKKLLHHTNYQPLWWADNISKGKKIGFRINPKS